jgi:hypothetical protein
MGGKWNCTVFEHDQTNNTCGQNHPRVASGIPGSDTATLTDAELPTIVSAAIARWQSAGLDSAGVTLLESLRVSIGDLPPGWLGAYVSGSIILDPTAAGDGWFVGAFAGDQGTEMALPGGVAASHIDPLTVVMHERGHALGLATQHPSGSRHGR